MLKKKLIETGILLIKMEIAHFTLVKLDILTVQERSVPKKSVMAISIFQMICIGHALEVPEPYQ